MLYDFVQCPHRVTMDLFGDPAGRDPVSPFVELLWKRGQAFEQETIANMGVPFVDLREGSPADRERLTLDAMRSGKGLIYGGRICSGDLIGEVGCPRPGDRLRPRVASRPQDCRLDVGRVP